MERIRTNARLRHALLLGASLFAAVCGCAREAGPSRDASPLRSGAPSPSSLTSPQSSPMSSPSSPLTSSGHHTVVNGSVTDKQGRPVSGCSIDDEGRTTEEAIVTGPDGRFTLYKSPGTYKVTVVCPGTAYRRTTVNLTVPSGDRKAGVDFTITVEPT